MTERTDTPTPMCLPPDISAVVALMRATDDKGKALSLGAVKGALAGYKPLHQAKRCPVIDLAARRDDLKAGGLQS